MRVGFFEGYHNGTAASAQWCERSDAVSVLMHLLREGDVEFRNNNIVK
jgi:hypothetical protein